MLSSVLASACAPNLSRFDVVRLGLGKGSGKMQVTLHEAADQGSGEVSSIVGPGGHRVSRATVGGYYLRRTDVTSPSMKLSAGLHAGAMKKKPLQ